MGTIRRLNKRKVINTECNDYCTDLTIVKKATSSHIEFYRSIKSYEDIKHASQDLYLKIIHSVFN